MAQARGEKPTRVKAREHRDRLRAQGLRPLQIWMPDVRASGGRTGNSLSVVASGYAADDQAFIDAASD